MASFNDARVRHANDRPANPDGKYVLYWCQMVRRLRQNHALTYAADLARKWKKPLVVYEGLKLNYPWASARFHQFLLEGMRDNAADAESLGITYWPFVETPKHPGHGLVHKLAQDSCVLVTDDYPQYIVPAQIRAISQKADVAVHAVDGNCLVPLSRLGPAVSAAAHLRPRIHKLFAEAWGNRAATEPHLTPATKVRVDPPFPTWSIPADLTDFVRGFPIDQTVPPVPGAVGGRVEGERLLAEFVAEKLPRYGDSRNLPDDPTRSSASGLSWHLHYGHLGIQQVCEAVLGKKWTVDQINPSSRSKADFFGDDPNVNSFLDEAITWRDVGYQWNFARLAAKRAANAELGTRSWQDPDEIPSFNFETADFSPPGKTSTLDLVLPEWAKATLRKHAKDHREHTYSPEEFELAKTHDELWNAAQRELVATGRIHNYLRMLWAKKVLEWSPTADDAYRTLEHLNNKYGIDGRDPNSYTGILWCFGLFDRPWAPERPIFGSVRYMSSENTAKKFKLAGYFDYIRRLPTIEEVRAGKPPEVRKGSLF